MNRLKAFLRGWLGISDLIRAQQHSHDRLVEIENEHHEQQMARLQEIHLSLADLRDDLGLDPLVDADEVKSGLRARHPMLGV